MQYNNNDNNNNINNNNNIRFLYTQLPVYEFWCTERYAYLVSELCEYADLANYVFQWKSWTGRGLPEPEARRVFRQLVSAVQYSHNSGFAHR